jgi:hypothetical protein
MDAFLLKYNLYKYISSIDAKTFSLGTPYYTRVPSMQFLLYVYQWKSLPDISSSAENIITYIQCCHTVR